MGYVNKFDQSLTIDHQLLLFENNATTWAWKFANSSKRCDKYELEAKVTCNSNNILDSWNITGNRKITVPVHREPYFYNFIGKYSDNTICQEKQTIFQVIESGIITLVSLLL